LPPPLCDLMPPQYWLLKGDKIHLLTELKS
jgi:hypothetical protein